MIVRRERAGDVERVRAVQAAAFDRGDGTEAAEAGLLDALRADPGWIPPLSIVAELPGPTPQIVGVVGHVVCTRGRVLDPAGAEVASAVGLGPIAVDPTVQRGGIGSALVHAALGAADALGFGFVALLGSPAYYGRFGFVRSTDVGIEPPEPAWGAHFQVRTLSAFDAAAPGRAFDAAAPGRFVYPAPFDAV